MNKINKYVPLTDKEIENDYEKIQEEYNQYLKKYNITLPAKDTNAMFQLIYLYHFLGQSVHKDVISTFVCEHNPKASGDQQTRHLGAQKGFCVFYNGTEYNGQKVDRGYYCLFTLKEANPSWAERKEARSIIMNTTDFDIIKKTFNYCCATCGAKEGTKHRYTGKTVILQQGHCHPDKPLQIGNIIPQCDYCNQNVYKNDFIFTLEGRPQSIYNPNYILKSPIEVQEQMYKILKKKFEQGVK